MKKSIRQIIAVVVVLTVLAAAGWCLRGGWNGRDDLRLAVVADKKVGIVTVSPVRRIMSVAYVNPEVKLWVPKGWGWYEADKIKRILDQSKEKTLATDTIFYNFGFQPHRIIRVNEADSWRNDWVLLENLGWLEWIKYKLVSRDMLVNNEMISGIDDPETDEILMRDFADNELLARDTRITVINTSEESGFAQFIAGRLEWLGMSVVGLETSQEGIEEECQILSGKANESQAEINILKQLWACKQTEDDGVPDGEVYLVLGEKLAQVLKYSSYK